MKKIFAEELVKQQQSLLKLISGNFEITMKETKNIKIEVNELKKALNLQRRFLKKKFRTCRGKLVAQNRKLKKYIQIDTDGVEKQLTDLEDGSRKNNLQIDGVAKENDESWDDCERKLKEIFMDKLELILLLKELIELKKQTW